MAKETKQGCEFFVDSEGKQPLTEKEITACRLAMEARSMFLNPFSPNTDDHIYVCNRRNSTGVNFNSLVDLQGKMTEVHIELDSLRSDTKYDGVPYYFKRCEIEFGIGDAKWRIGLCYATKKTGINTLTGMAKRLIGQTPEQPFVHYNLFQSDIDFNNLNRSLPQYEDVLNNFIQLLGLSLQAYKNRDASQPYYTQKAALAAQQKAESQRARRQMLDDERIKQQEENVKNLLDKKESLASR